MSKQDTPKESQRTSAILGYLNRLPECWAVKYHGSAYSTNGVPDILCCYRGKFVAIEVKRTESHPTTPAQDRQLGKIQDANGLAGVCVTIDDVILLLEELDAR